MSPLNGGKGAPTGEGRVESVIASEAMTQRKSANVGNNSRNGTRCGNGADNRLLITDPTNGLLSRGSQVRILPGVPFS